MTKHKSETGAQALQDVFDFSGTDDVLIEPEHAARMVGLTPRRIRAMALAGEFPAPEKVGYRTLRYWRGDVIEWLRCRREGRRWVQAPRARPAASGVDAEEVAKPAKGDE
jgi:predicted DNA-binding transcriptional regulator AlpA